MKDLAHHRKYLQKKVVHSAALAEEENFSQDIINKDVMFNGEAEVAPEFLNFAVEHELEEHEDKLKNRTKRRFEGIVSRQHANWEHRAPARGRR